MCNTGIGPSWVKSPPCTIKLGWIRWKVHFRYPSPWTQGSFVLLPVSLSLTLHKTRKTSCIPHPVNKTGYYYFRYIHHKAHKATSYYFRDPSPCTLQYTDHYFLRYRLPARKPIFLISVTLSLCSNFGNLQSALNRVSEDFRWPLSLFCTSTVLVKTEK